MVNIMNNSFLALTLTLISGLSTLLGGMIIYYKKNEKTLAYSLVFSAGVMLTVSFFDLIIESYKYLNEFYFPFPSLLLVGIFFSFGVIISFTIDKYISSDNEIYKVGLISLIAIILHNIPEGMATFIASDNNISLGITLTIAIALHNIPEGITIALPIFYATNRHKKAIIYTLIAGLSEFLGGIVTFLFLKPYINFKVMGYLLALIAGIMTQISLYELIPQAKKILDTKKLILPFLAGFIIMLTTIFVL